VSPHKSPAFSLYAKDFVTGTSTMSLQEVGAYIRLLCYQWDSGSVPNDAKERSRIIGCSRSQERELWNRVGKKFLLANDVFLNERLEEERYKQAERSQKLSANGKLGGRPAKAKGKQLLSSSFPETKAEKSLSSSSSFSSSNDSSKNDESTTTERVRVEPLILSPLQFARLQETHAFVGSKLRVPKALHAELVAKSGANAHVELTSWYERLNEELELAGKGTGDVFAWLRPRHQAFAVEKGWIDAAPRPSAPQPAFRGVAAILAEAEAKKAGAR
jgi:uncharacterized protein YdaU (DUF1376 family)